MKKHLLTFAFAVATIVAGATVIVVDNNGNAPAGVESNLSTAITNATSGDTILVTPSSLSYSNIIVSKPLTIIGVGFNPDMEIPFTSTVGQVTIGTAASGTKIIGMWVSSAIVLGNSAGSLSNIVIENCRLNYVTNSGISSLTNILIRQNVIQSQSSVQSLILTVANQSNIIVSNNVFSSQSGSTFLYGPYVTTGGVVFDHNLFLGSSSQYAFYDLNNCIVKNNIFLGRHPGFQAGASSNVLYQNNISTDYAFSIVTGNNISFDTNIDNTSPVFANLDIGTIAYLYSMDPTMSAGSPGENAGTDGTNLGVSGGTSPFKLSGSVLPVVRRFIVPSNITQGQNADATIEVTGN